MTNASDPWWIRHRWLLLAGLMLLAGFFRLYLLDITPPTLHPNEALNGLDALHALEAADFRVFYPGGGGREGMFVNLVALMIQMFGPLAWTIRATAALAGIATIPAMAFLAYEFGLAYFAKESKQKRDRLGWAFMLVAALLLTVSAWHVHFARLGMRAILLPLFAGGGFGFLLRGFRLGRSSDFAFSGVLVALAMLTYPPARLLLLVAAVPLFITGWQKTDNTLTFVGGAEWLKRAGVFVALLLLVLLPAMGYFITHPTDFSSAFTADDAALSGRAAQTLAMFHLSGGELWTYGVADRPVLDPLLGALLLIGLLLLLRDLARSRMALLLSSWMGIALLATMLTPAIPQPVAALMLLLPVMLISAIGAIWLIRRLIPSVPESIREGVVALIVVLMLLFNFHQYFFAWAPSPQLDEAFRGDLTRISGYLSERITQRDEAEAELLNEQEALAEDSAGYRVLDEEIQQIREAKDYVLVNEAGHPEADGAPLPAAVIRYLTLEHPEIVYITQNSLAEVVPVFGETVIVVTEAPNEDLTASIQAAFPGAERQERNGYTVYRL